MDFIRDVNYKNDVHEQFEARLKKLANMMNMRSTGGKT